MEHRSGGKNNPEKRRVYHSALADCGSDDCTGERIIKISNIQLPISNKMSNVKISNFMTEALQQNIEKPRSEWPIEQQANFEGSWTNLMCERLRNPEIRKQVIDLLVEKELDAKGRPSTDEFYDDSGNQTMKYFVPRLRGEIEIDFENNLENVQKETPISFSAEMPHSASGGREILNLNWISTITGKKPTAEVWNIIESHEKGHALRTYGFLTQEGVFWESNLFDERFQNVFDFSKIKFTQEEYKRWQNSIESEKEKSKTFNEFCDNNIQYLKSPMELAERMSQLKNYFGMSGAERFTKEHLGYAREHYIKDTDFDNDMTQFFQAITPEKEDAFIELINSAGI
jgi:hypothetical protein